ncbi:MAG TPA: DUF2252 domain-containing protein [Trebonia sp.]|nr:DUF2252 domain-containing protein [Trebonia sp.]
MKHQPEMASLPRDEQARLGKAARKRVPRHSHADLRPSADRDPVGLLERQARTRVADLVPVRYGRMLASPFSYFRGAALPMAADLATTPATGFTVQACGDAHLSNFGLFASPERRLLFDVNDFDETLPGPWEWDVKRLAASLEIAARENGVGRRQRRAIVASAVARYREAITMFAGMSSLDTWYSAADVSGLRDVIDSRLTKRQRRVWDRSTAKARASDSMKALSKLTTMVEGKPRIAADPPLIVPAEDLFDVAEESPEVIAGVLSRVLGRYRRTLETDRRRLLDRYRFSHMARKVVGVGSVGTRCWIVLMLDPTDSSPLFLQVKEAQPSVLSDYAQATTFRNEGQRVVAGQRLMQAASDIFLGWDRVAADVDGEPRDYYVRQLRDWKFSLDMGALRPEGLELYGQACGWTLARAHAKSGQPSAIAGYLGSSPVFDEAVADFAAGYADLMEGDYRALASATASGRVEALTGV